MADYTRLREEIDDDPLGLGYASETDAQVSVLLNTFNRPVGEFTVESVQIYEAVDDTEFEALNASQKSRVRDIYSLSGAIEVSNSRVRAVLLALFPAGSATRNALAGLVPPDITRGQEIGLGPGRTRESDVFKARAL